MVFDIPAVAAPWKGAQGAQAQGATFDRLTLRQAQGPQGRRFDVARAEVRRSKGVGST